MKKKKHYTMEDLEETRIMDDMENQGFKSVQATISNTLQ